MSCDLVFDCVYEGGDRQEFKIRLNARHLQHALLEGKATYRAREQNGFDPLSTQKPRIVCGTRSIPLHVSPTQVQPFSLQM